MPFRGSFRPRLRPYVRLRPRWRPLAYWRPGMGAPRASWFRLRPLVRLRPRLRPFFGWFWRLRRR